MILLGRKTPPSDDELRAAGEAGAMWVGTRPVVQNLMGTERPRMTAVLSSSPGFNMGLHYDDDLPATRWFYLEPDGTMSNGPVAWPDATFGAACVRLWNDPKSLDALRDVQLAAEGRLRPVGTVRASAGTRPSDAFVEACTVYWRAVERCRSVGAAGVNAWASSIAHEDRRRALDSVQRVVREVRL